MIQLIHGDCLEKMRDIPDGSIDLILTDPPYGTTACKWDSVIPFAPMWEQLKRIIKPRGAICLFGSQPFTTALGASNIQMLKYNWVWQKSRPSGHLNAKKSPLRDLEDILVFYQNNPTYNPQGTVRCNVAKVNTPKRIKNGTTYHAVGNAPDVHLQEQTNYPRQVLSFRSPHNVGAVHPTQKPVTLLEYLIKTYTNEGETVLDFTMGSGSTGVACVNTKRNFVGIEKDPAYFEIACKRILS